MTETKLIAITGNSGSGKSEVIKFLNELGYFTLSADAIAKKLSTDCEEVISEIRKEFPESWNEHEKSLDRKKLHAAIINSPIKKRSLEKILHPRIQREVDRILNDTSNVSTKENYVFYEIPLLFETDAHSTDRFDFILLIVSDDTSLVKRIMKRDSLEEVEANKRLEMQMDQSKKLHLANYVIENNGSIEDLRNQIDIFLSQLNKIY